jgi:hypothetical protein
MIIGLVVGASECRRPDNNFLRLGPKLDLATERLLQLILNRDVVDHAYHDSNHFSSLGPSLFRLFPGASNWLFTILHP